MQLHNQILIGLCTGAAAGVAAHALSPGTGIGALTPAAAAIAWLTDSVCEPIGQVFLRGLLMTVIPLVFASLVLGVAGLGDVRRLGKTGASTMLYFLATTAVAVVVGLVLVQIVQPGAGMDPAVRDGLLEKYRAKVEGMQAGAGKLDVQTLVNMVPRNPVKAAADLEMLPWICFAIVFGAALTLLPPARQKPMLDFLDSLGAIVVKVIDLVLKLAPYGVFGLIFATTARFGFTILEHLGWYALVVVFGLALHGVVILSALVALLGRMSPWRFWRGARAAAITAFSTSSSSATLPTTMLCAERELGVPPKVAGFVLPLGATLNMNGTALYEGVTVLFLAAVFGVPLDLGQQAIVVVMSVLTAVGTAGVPGGSLPLLMGVLAAVGVPPEGLAVILGIDRILDMCRTVLNVTGDLTASVVIARFTPARS